MERRNWWHKRGQAVEFIDIDCRCLSKALVLYGGEIRRSGPSMKSWAMFDRVDAMRKHACDLRCSCRLTCVMITPFLYRWKIAFGSMTV